MTEAYPEDASGSSAEGEGVMTELPPEVRVTEGSGEIGRLLREEMEPDLILKTGLTEGRRYDILVRPREGRPVLIAVHL